MEDDGAPQDSLLPYDVWMEESLRYVVMRALAFAATNELPGKHHYYVTFRTDFPGVAMPQRLREKYPQEMTIVLQHQFADLAPGETFFSVTLRFGGVPKNLSIPYAAITQFWDPTADYSLAFTVPDPPPPAPAPALPPKPAADKGDDGPKIVSLDQFRKK